MPLINNTPNCAHDSCFWFTISFNYSFIYLILTCTIHKCLFNILKNAVKNIYNYVIYLPRSVRIGKNCALGLEYGPRPQGTVFPYTDRPRQVNNIFIFSPTFASLQINRERLSERA